MGIVVIGNEMMSPIHKPEWDEQHLADLAKFQEDHRQLISLFQELDTAVRDGKAGTLRLVLLGLTSYAQGHFAAEEEVMEQIDYSDSEAHMAEHRAFSEKLHDFVRAYEIGDTGVSLEVVSYLRSWLDHHLNVTDRAFESKVRGGCVQ